MSDKEKFPIKRPGDSLSAAHINALSEVAKRDAGNVSGTNLVGIKGPINSVAAPPYFVKNVLIVIGQESAGIYKVRQRYYDHKLGGWRTNYNTNHFLMDASDVGATYEQDDKAVAYWCEQRAMYIPMLGVETEEDRMWCGTTCFWVQECCVYRGTVRRIHQSPNYCELIEESQPAWLVHSPFFDEALVPGDDGYLVPESVLPPNAIGWVRKISDSLECTYNLPNLGGETVELTEDLPVFEWCLVQIRKCPLETQIVTVRFSFNYNPEFYDEEGRACREACKARLKGIGSVELKWQSWEKLMEIPLQNLPECSQVQELYEFGAWVGEFEVPTTQPVRLFPAFYKVRTGPGPTEIDNEIGWVRLDWCTGELIQLYRNDNGDHIPETREWWDLVVEPGCYSPLNSDGTEWREEIQYEYRLIFACLPQYGVKDLCVQHIHPHCHIWAGEALQDAGRGENMQPICMNSYTCKFDSDFGHAPMRGGPVGYFYGGGPSQFSNHRFAGCCNSMDQYCAMLFGGLEIRAVITW